MVYMVWSRSDGATARGPFIGEYTTRVLCTAGGEGEPRASNAYCLTAADGIIEISTAVRAHDGSRCGGDLGRRRRRHRLPEVDAMETHRAHQPLGQLLLRLRLEHKPTGRFQERSRKGLGS